MCVIASESRIHFGTFFIYRRVHRRTVRIELQDAFLAPINSLLPHERARQQLLPCVCAIVPVACCSRYRSQVFPLPGKDTSAVSSGFAWCAAPFPRHTSLLRTLSLSTSLPLGASLLGRPGCEELWPDATPADVELGAPLQRGLLAHQAEVPVAHRLELAVTARSMAAALLLRSLQAYERQEQYAADVHQYGAGHPKQSPAAQCHGRIIASEVKAKRRHPKIGKRSYYPLSGLIYPLGCPARWWRCGSSHLCTRVSQQARDVKDGEQKYELKE
uniref:Uncharacterized protein n=1 Tax=Anopheles farauti TaxID=69004 RepID=A0A182Q9U7_9DIPT